MPAVNDPRRMELFGGKPKDTFKPPARQDALGNKIPEPEEEIALIEKEIQELKMAFEQYFLGFDRRAPLRRRDQLNERIRRFKQGNLRMPTMLKHRLDQAHAKFSSYDRTWARTLSEIESGTYKRDLFKMKMRQKTAAEAPPPDAADSPAARPAAPASPQAQTAPLTAGQIKALYDAYITARKRTNESTDGITADGLGRSLLKQVPALMQKYDCKAIDFKVVIKDNKAILRAVPRR
jgi:hypothetical protein